MKKDDNITRKVTLEPSDERLPEIDIKVEAGKKGRWMDEIQKKWAFTAVLVFAIVITIFFIFERFSSFVSILGTIWNILQPFVIGFAVAYLLMPVFNFFERKLTPFCSKRLKKPGKGKKVSKTLSTIITIVLAIVLVGSIIWLVLPQVLQSLYSIISSLPGKMDALYEAVDTFLADYPEAQAVLNNMLDNTRESLMDWLKNTLLPGLADTVASITSGIIGVVGVLLNVVIGVIICVYVLNSKEVFTAQSKKMLYSHMTVDHANSCIAFGRLFNRIFGGFLTGKILDAIFVGIVCFVLMVILRIPYAMMVSVIVACTNIIPFFGPFIGAIPSALIIFMESPVKMIWFIIMILVLQQIDGNIIEPHIVGDSTGLPGFWVLFAIMVGGGLWGFIGMIIGVPIVALIYALVGSASAMRLRNKDLPDEMEDYKTIDHIDEESNEPVYFQYDEYGTVIKEKKKEKKNSDSANDVMSSFIKVKKKGDANGVNADNGSSAAEAGTQAETAAEEEKNQ